MLKLENEIRESLCSLCNNLNLRGGDPSLVSNRPICCQLCNVSKQNVFSTPVLVFLEMISNLSEAATSVPFDIERHFLQRRELTWKMHFSNISSLPSGNYNEYNTSWMGRDRFVYLYCCGSLWDQSSIVNCCLFVIWSAEWWDRWSSERNQNDNTTN